MNRIEKQQDVLKTYHFKKISENETEILYEKSIKVKKIIRDDACISIWVCIYKDYEKKKKVDPEAMSYVLFYYLKHGDQPQPLRKIGFDMGKIDRLIETLLLQLGAIEDESI